MPPRLSAAGRWPSTSRSCRDPYPSVMPRLAALLAAALVASACTTAAVDDPVITAPPTPPPPVTATPGPPLEAEDEVVELARRKIRHVVYLIKENRTFDHMFGRFPGADGATTGLTCAERYVLADRFFSSTYGPTGIEHLFTVGATTDGFTDHQRETPPGQFGTNGIPREYCLDRTERMWSFRLDTTP